MLPPTNAKERRAARRSARAEGIIEKQAAMDFVNEILVPRRSKQFQLVNWAEYERASKTRPNGEISEVRSRYAATAFDPGNAQPELKDSKRDRKIKQDRVAAGGGSKVNYLLALATLVTRMVFSELSAKYTQKYGCLGKSENVPHVQDITAKEETTFENLIFSWIPISEQEFNFTHPLRSYVYPADQLPVGTVAYLLGTEAMDKVTWEEYQQSQKRIQDDCKSRALKSNYLQLS